MLAPIVIFAFNRLEPLKKLLCSLQMNSLFEESELFIFIDGARNENEQIKVNQVISYSRTVTKNVKISTVNKGLGTSIITGVSEIISKYGKAIVLEDDLVLMPGFLSYMNTALDLYESDSRIFSICGYGLKVRRPKNYEGDVYLGIRSSSWGWATWKNRWNTVDWSISDWDQLQRDRRKQREFNKGGSDMYGMLKGYMNGKNHSWAIRFCYNQYKQGCYSVHPFLSFVDNEGFGNGATNCKSSYCRFKTILNTKRQLLYMPRNLKVCQSILSDNAFYHSLLLRLYSRLRSLF